MIKFHIPHHDGALVDARLLHNEDGDLSLELDGIEVLYISSRTGHIIFALVDHGERARLEAAGFCFNEEGELEHG